ncbi:MAG TPA: AMP-binding protein, partial [Candidatus Methanoperedenaceae archaeon]|nr:AMP-binding protein [Candidatus Methanoperedenaceae archaeon]
MADIIESLLEEKRIFNPTAGFSRKALVRDFGEYRQLYERSIKDPASFWEGLASGLTWSRKWDRVHYWDPENAICRWFEGGRLNASQNCLDRHLGSRGSRTALIWEGEPGDTRRFTYQELYTEVCKFANVLKKMGIKKGDRVA